MPTAISSIEIIVDPGNKGWILEKIANRVCEEFKKLNLIANVRNAPKFDSDVTFWVQFTDKTLSVDSTFLGGNLRSTLVTHVDDAQKLSRVKKLYHSKIDLIFMSKMHASSIANSIGITQLPESVRIGSDLAEQKKNFHIGIVSKCYPDGRKNENWLLDFEKKGLFKNVTLTIIGTGWKSIADKLISKGVDVNLLDNHKNPYPDYDEIIDIQKNFDLFFYFGFDEGSLGALDAYLLGTDLLITNQGFHTSFELSKDSFCENLIDAQQKFELKKAKYYANRELLGDWSWTNTANELLLHWMKVFEDDLPPVENKLKSRFSWVYLNHYLKLLPKTFLRLMLVRIPQKIKSKLFKQ